MASLFFLILSMTSSIKTDESPSNLSISPLTRRLTPCERREDTKFWSSANCISYLNSELFLKHLFCCFPAIQQHSVGNLAKLCRIHCANILHRFACSLNLVTVIV